MIEAGDIGHDGLLVRPQRAHDVYSTAQAVSTAQDSREPQNQRPREGERDSPGGREREREAVKLSYQKPKLSPHTQLGGVFGGGGGGALGGVGRVQWWWYRVESTADAAYACHPLPSPPLPGPLTVRVAWGQQRGCGEAARLPW